MLRKGFSHILKTCAGLLVALCTTGSGLRADKEDSISLYKAIRIYVRKLSSDQEINEDRAIAYNYTGRLRRVIQPCLKQCEAWAQQTLDVNITEAFMQLRNLGQNKYHLEDRTTAALEAKWEKKRQASR